MTKKKPSQADVERLVEAAICARIFFLNYRNPKAAEMEIAVNHNKVLSKSLAPFLKARRKDA